MKQRLRLMGCPTTANPNAAHPQCVLFYAFVVQQESIPQAVLGQDIICQAKSGMGKTAVFVLAVLQQLDPVDMQVDTLVLCHTRELAYQICQEFLRFRYSI